MKEDLLKGLSEEQIAKLNGCKNNEEILELAKKEGISLTDAQLEAVNGGGCGDAGSNSKKCPECGSTNVVLSEGTKGKTVNGFMVSYYKCKDCGKVFYVI